MTKIRCGIRENAKYLDGIRDLTAAREAGFTKFGYGMRDSVACLSGIREIVTTQKTLTAAKANQPGERQISIERANLHLKFISFCRNQSFLTYFWERRNEIRDSDEKSAGCGILVVKEWECGIRTPLPDPVENLTARNRKKLLMLPQAARRRMKYCRSSHRRPKLKLCVI